MIHRACRLGIVLAVAVGCASSAPKPAPTPSAEKASARLARLVAAEPQTFKMVHIVVARFQGQSYPMNGYLLGRKDGSFRVSASLAVGPKAFDVARLSGRWDSRIHLQQAAGRVDPLEIGHAVERIYFRGAEGPLASEEGAWVARQSIPGEDVDAVEVWRRPEDLAVFRKRFFRGERVMLEILYDDWETVQGQPIARRVRLEDKRGFELELKLTDYQPGFPAPDQKLRLAD